MNDPRALADRLERFIAEKARLAAAGGGCASNAEEPAALLADFQPMHMAVYGPPPFREVDRPVANSTVANEIFFGGGRLEPDEKSAPVLASQIALLKRMDKRAVTLEGHCDERGSGEYNLALGQRRAEAVKRALVAAGIADERITALSFGKERPRAPGHDETAWAKNRRVDIIVK